MLRMVYQSDINGGSDRINEIKVTFKIYNCKFCILGFIGKHNIRLKLDMCLIRINLNTFCLSHPEYMLIRKLLHVHLAVKVSIVTNVNPEALPYS